MATLALNCIPECSAHLYLLQTPYLSLLMMQKKKARKTIGTFEKYQSGTCQVLANSSYFLWQTQIITT